MVSEEVPGPPPDTTKIRSKAFSASIVRITVATMMCGQTSGTVRWRNVSHAEAPSMRAASNGSVGRLASPPSTISITSGVHCQVSTSTSVGITEEAA